MSLNHRSASMGVRVLAVLLIALLSACAKPPLVAPVLSPFEQDLVQATDALIEAGRARRLLPLFLTRLSPHTLALGPFVDARPEDAAPAAFALPQSRAAALARQIVARRIDTNAPEFRRVSLAEGAQPALLLSARLTFVGTARYLLTLTLLDTQTHVVQARWQGLVRVAAEQAMPTAFEDESPALHYEARAPSLFAAAPGEPVVASEAVAGLARALIEQGQEAYVAARYERALTLFRQAATQPGVPLIRAYNGQYLSQMRLGREEAARQAFRQVVEQGFAARALALKLLFSPGSTDFLKDPAVSGVYGFWLKEIAARAVAGAACLKVVGHTSRTGLEAFNQELSLQRSQRVQHLLVTHEGALSSRLQALGVGWAENIVGSGTDDARDAIDRRVEFRIVDCSGS